LKNLTSVLREDTKIGVSGGNAVYHTIRSLPIEQSSQRQIIQLGGVGNAEDSPLNTAGLVQLLAEAIGGACHYLYVPMIVESNTVRNALMLEPHVRDTLKLARHADITLIGIGAPGSELGQLNPAYPSTPASVDKLGPGYTVGAIFGQVFDVNGTVLDVDINKRVIGLELNSLRENKRVVAVAGGESKALAILGALRGGYVDVMITDEKAARMILEVDRHLNAT
jgi:deoxyribonucleoside regulator